MRGDETHGKPTLEELAAQAGVDRRTVARAIRHPPSVSTRTRLNVELAILGLGYGSASSDRVVRLLSELLREDPDAVTTLRKQIPKILRWTRFLPNGGTETMIAELVGATQAAHASDTVVTVAQVLVEWRHTAEIYADPELLRELTRDRDGDAGPVPFPVVEEQDGQRSDGEEGTVR